MKNNQPVDKTQLYEIINDSTDGLFDRLVNATSDDQTHDVFSMIESSNYIKELAYEKPKLLEEIKSLNFAFQQRMIANVDNCNAAYISTLCSEYLDELTKVLSNKK